MHAAGNFRGFRGLRAIREIWGRAAPTMLFQAIRESFLREILTSYGSAKVFSLESLPLYGVCTVLARRQKGRMMGVAFRRWRIYFDLSCLPPGFCLASYSWLSFCYSFST